MARTTIIEPFFEVHQSLKEGERKFWFVLRGVSVRRHNRWWFCTNQMVLSVTVTWKEHEKCTVTIWFCCCRNSFEEWAHSRLWVQLWFGVGGLFRTSPCCVSLFCERYIILWIILLCPLIGDLKCKVLYMWVWPQFLKEQTELAFDISLENGSFILLPKASTIVLLDVRYMHEYIEQGKWRCGHHVRSSACHLLAGREAMKLHVCHWLPLELSAGFGYVVQKVDFCWMLIVRLSDST